MAWTQCCFLGASESVSDLQAMIRNLENALEQGFTIGGEWVGRPVAVGVDIYQDFGLATSADDDEQRLKRAVSGLWSRAVLLREDKRAGLLSDSEDLDAIVQEIEDEGGVFGEGVDDGDNG